LFWEDFSNDEIPPGWVMEPNWQVGSDGWEGHVIGDPSPGAFFWWTPPQNDYEGAMTTPVINVGDEPQVLVEFFFELDFYLAGSATNGLRIEYLSGGDWVTVLSYEISPSAGDVDLSGRYESFTADVNGDFRIRWVAYGTNSTYINSWDVDNIRVSTLPKLTYVNIESSNEDPSTAYEGTYIWLNFTTDTEFLFDPYVQINGNPCNIDNLGYSNWVAYYTVQESDPDGPLQFTIDFTDNTGVEGKTVKETTDGSTVIVDNSDPPSFTVGTVTAAGGTVASEIWNSTNAEIQLDVNIPEDSAVTSFSYTIGNSLLFNGMNDEVIISGITDYQATDALTIEAWIKPNSWSDFDGILNYAKDQGASEAGFGFVYFATGWRFFLKTTSNSIDYISMAEVSTPSGQWTHLAATYDGEKVRIYRNGSVIDSTDAMGDIKWSGAPSDFKLGNFTKDGSTGYFDGQIDDVRIWNIVRTGIQIKASREITIDKNESGLVGYWQMDAGSGVTATDSTSAANHGIINGATWVVEDSPLNFQAPVYDTGVIVGSAFQLRGRINTNDFELFGEKDTITVNDLNAGIKIVSASNDAFEAITDFAHEETAQLSAFLFDVTGNYSSGDTSITNTVIDIITNSPTPVSISSDNTFSHLAKTGDVVTITMAYDEDVNTPAVTVDGNDADDVSDLGGEQFSSSYTLTGSESEGSLSFTINTTDYVGNSGTHLGSTDGSNVYYDKTLPTLSPVSIASNNADTTWAKANDSISVIFTSNEEISADFAISFDGIDDEVKITGSGFISGNEPRSISVWANGSSGNIVSLGDGAGTSNQRFSILISSGRRVLIIGQNNDWHTNYYLPQNQMIHLVVTHDGSTVKLYANGVFQDQTTKTYNTDSTMPIMIGTNTDDRDSEYFNGIIDNVIITRDALSIGEVSALYNGSDVALDNLIAKFNFNEGSGSIAYDRSSNGNDGVLKNMDLTSAWFFQGGSGPTATIMSQDASISTINSDQFRADYTTTITDPEGEVQFGVLFADLAGNEGETVTSTTNNSRVIFDRTAPADFTVGIVTATGGNVVANVWNSTNTGLNVNVPIASDTTLKNGTVQLLAKISSNTFTAIGSVSTITNSDLGSDKLMSLDSAEVEALSGFAEEDSIYIKAVMNDRPGNETVGTESSSRLLIDETPPSLISASYESNFSDSSLATVGHVVTLTFETDVEIQTPSATISTQNGIISDLGSNRWSASYEMQDGDTEGVIPFQIATLTDSRGNPTEGTSSTTDGTEVTFDNTQPTLNPVTILSDNPDTEWAKVGDTVTVTFTGEETLISQTASIVTQSATITDLGSQVYTAKYKMTGSDPEGEVAFEIIVTDGVEIDSDPVTQTNDDTAVIYDRTAPTLSTVHIESDNDNNTLIAIGGDNIYLTFTPQEPLILDSIVVTIASLATTLTESNGSYTATLTLTGSEPGGILEYTIDFKDRAGNPGIQVTATTDESYVNHDIYPPEIEIVSITSNNSDSTWAKVGDSVFVTFTASETLNNISITIAGVSSSYNELSGAKYQGYHVMDESNDEGDIPFLITYTDLGGAIGPDADTTTNNTNVQFDKTVPEFSLTRMATNNVYGDSLAGIGSVDTLSFTISENQRDLNVELAGTQKTPEQEELKFITTHTFSESDEDGWVSFTLSMTDSAGNPSDTLMTTQDGSQVRFDGTFPILPIVNFFSNNSNDSSVCIPGDSLFLQYTSSETLRTATITLAGSSPDESGWLGGFNYASYVLTGTEDEGFIPFTIGFEDWVGNPGDTISGTTNGSSVLFDMTPPDDFTLGNVVSKNGIEVAGYWNASNQSLEIVIPVANDETLTGGGIQIQASFGGSYSNLADTVDIDQGDLGMEKIVSISETDFESMAEFNENGNATFQAVLWDKAGNSTIGTASSSTIHIDQTLPILGMVSQRTNNAIADSLAKVGDTDTLIVSSTEGLDTLQVQIFSQDAVHSGANRDWTFTYSFQETDNDGMVSFNIVFGDTAGNLGTDVSTTTDGSTVRFDGTKPTLTSVSFSSTNVIDGGLAILADTLYLDFISDEDLLTKEVLIAGFDADTTFENVSRTPFRSWRIMDGTEPEGYIEFEIGYSDLVGNIGDTVEETTNETSILFDMTPPDDFELDTVFVSGGKVIYGFWNASNDTLTLRVPIPEDDETLIGGTFQPQVRFGEGAYVNLGDEKIIIGGQGVSSQDLKITRMEFTTANGYSDNENVQFIAKAKDRAGNETVGSTDNTPLHIDEIVPSLTEVLIQSNNELDSTWAKISDIISLNFTASEGLFSVMPVLFSDSLTGIPENAGSSWTVTKTILSDNAEGVIPFYITYNDTAGNEGDQVSSSTDGRSVTLDKTNPTITSLLEGNEGLDINYYNQADSITLYWSEFDSLAGVKDAYVGLGTDSNLTDVLDWTLSNQNSLAGLGGLSLSNDGIYFGAVFVRDSAGNYSDTLWGNSIYIDTQNPDTGSVIDAYWVMDLDYAIDSTRLSYIWSNFTDNTEIDYFEIAIGTEDDTANVMNWMRSDSTDSMTVTGLNLVRDTLYYSYIRAFDLATNKSLAAQTDGVYFDDNFPVVNKITPNVNSDSAGFLSVLANDTLTIKFNRPIYEYGLSVNSNVDSNLTISHEYGDSIITVIWTDTLASYDTLTVIVDSAVAYNTLWFTDTLHFYSKLWADLNNDYDITIEDILTFNQTWPETDLGPFKDEPPHVRPEPDGEANLTDLAAFGKMWHWKYFNLEFDTTLIAARSTDGLKIIAQGSKANITIPKDVAMAEILIGESNLDIEKMHFVNPSGSAFMFTSSDTAHGLIQFSMADHRGFDSTLTLIIPETEQEYFQAQIQYKFMDITGINLADGIASIDVEILPDKFMVYNNYPNPFNPITAINYDLPEVRDVNIIIYDLLGRTIRHLDLNKVKAGRHKFVWHGTNDYGKRVSTGIYFLQITAGQDIQTQKMLLLK
jgi:hypothetical protein